jgi:aspartyl aminopeptidase
MIFRSSHFPHVFRTVDIGCAQLSMHSIREMAGSEDVDMLIALFEKFFSRYEWLDSEDHAEGAVLID